LDHNDHAATGKPTYVRNLERSVLLATSILLGRLEARCQKAKNSKPEGKHPNRKRNNYGSELAARKATNFKPEGKKTKPSKHKQQHASQLPEGIQQSRAAVVISAVRRKRKQSHRRHIYVSIPTYARCIGCTMMK
jgi:hypothetical protein